MGNPPSLPLLFSPVRALSSVSVKRRCSLCSLRHMGIVAKANMYFALQQNGSVNGSVQSKSKENKKIPAI